MKTTDNDVPLLKRRKGSDNDAESGVSTTSANPADERSDSENDSLKFKWSPEELACESNQFHWKLVASGHAWIINLATFLVPTVAIWLYVQSLIALSHYRPAQHWPEPIPSIASACINASTVPPTSACENVFYLQLSTVSFLTFNLLNCLVWEGMWSFACTVVRGVRVDRKHDIVTHFANDAHCIMFVAGWVAWIVLMLFYIGSGYRGLSCGERGLPECVLGLHPVFFDVIGYFLQFITAAGICVILLAASCVRV